MDKKKDRPKDIFSAAVISMNRQYLVGDFFHARKSAKGILSSESADDEDMAAAQIILKRTWPDFQALLAGVGCLIFVVVATFWASGS